MPKSLLSVSWLLVVVRSEVTASRCTAKTSSMSSYGSLRVLVLLSLTLLQPLCALH